MCGRYANSETIPAQAARCKADLTPDLNTWKPTWNAAPSQRHPVVIQDMTSRRIGLMSWGWKPEFMSGKMLVNARGEEALGKRTFTEAMYRRRCIVPALLFHDSTLPKSPDLSATHSL
ncbi:MAG: SOS response-associated peptidase family protein [Planctomycetota bacterium]